ncbi:MAG: YhbY family RNA-binding protein [Gammaproteobacteria bacterium]|nr:YhbY family RNA-binding protein [Gammaproteobacteria bacterium]
MSEAHPLSNKQIRQLRSLAHNLKPVVRLGQHGITEAVCKELSNALDHHELVKIKLSVADRPSRLQQLKSLCGETDAVCIQQIGHTATLFRRNLAKPVIHLQALG